MQNAAGDGVAQAPHDRNDAYRAVVSDLVSLVEHVQNSLRLIERMIARETSAETPPETSPCGSESSTAVGLAVTEALIAICQLSVVQFVHR